jgi:hypothetical protein
VTLLLDPVLDRLGQHGRIGQRGHFRPRRLQRREDRRDRAFGIDRHLLARERRQLRRKCVVTPHRHRIAEMGAQFGRHLLLGDEQIGGAIGMGDHEA